MLLTAYDVEPALAAWPRVVGSTIRLINHSENQIFDIDAGAQGRFVLRVHRSGYQSRPSIESELTWLAAVRRDTVIPVPEPIAGDNGHLLQSVATTQGDRVAVLFRYVPGAEPTLVRDAPALFQTLGHYAATLHSHAQHWQRPPAFIRPVWNAQSILDASSLWGDWRTAPGVDAPIRNLLDRLTLTLTRRLAAYGTAPDRFGLIHGDMRLGNLLVTPETTTLIDFDDCGFSWFTYDFAAAISFHETHSAIPSFKAAWLDHYQRVRKLSVDDIAIIETMILLRRMALLAWIGSHGETSLAQRHQPGFAAGTADLTERYLGGNLWA